MRARRGEGSGAGVEADGWNGDRGYRSDGFLTWQEMRDVYKNSGGHGRSTLPDFT